MFLRCTLIKFRYQRLYCMLLLLYRRLIVLRCTARASLPGQHDVLNQILILQRNFKLTGSCFKTLDYNFVITELRQSTG